ncbi:hypothetical protein BT69DRAFT_949665 [Atractiella rhizophila]|nr:hypothetical protein BT69DRAFT_949665 [Atractiella rhizophila]
MTPAFSFPSMTQPIVTANYFIAGTILLLQTAPLPSIAQISSKLILSTSSNVYVYLWTFYGFLHAVEGLIMLKKCVDKGVTGAERVKWCFWTTLYGAGFHQHFDKLAAKKD